MTTTINLLITYLADLGGSYKYSNWGYKYLEPPSRE